MGRETNVFGMALSLVLFACVTSNVLGQDPVLQCMMDCGGGGNPNDVTPAMQACFDDCNRQFSEAPTPAPTSSAPTIAPPTTASPTPEDLSQCDADLDTCDSACNAADQGCFENCFVEWYSCKGGSNFSPFAARQASAARARYDVDDCMNDCDVNFPGDSDCYRSCFSSVGPMVPSGNNNNGKVVLDMSSATALAVLALLVVLVTVNVVCLYQMHCVGATNKQRRYRKVVQFSSDEECKDLNQMEQINIS